jgi:hypothetical protein
MNNLFTDSGLPDWKPVGRSFRSLVYADRILAVLGGIVFGVFYSTSVVIVPAYFLSWYLSSTTTWMEASHYMAIISFVFLQAIMAYLREAYFYDSFAIYVFLGGLFILFLLFVNTVALAYMLKEGYFVHDMYQIVVVVVLQTVEGLLAMQCA